jgi:hypothetical protein
MSRRLAFLTFGVLLEPVGHPTVQGFVDRVPPVYEAADKSEGFLDRSIRDVVTWKHSWGDVVRPACYRDVDDEKRIAMTLSLWKDLESLAAFAYFGPHGEAFSKSREWVDKRPGVPTSVGWWVSKDHEVDWQEAADRMDHLHQNGSTAFAFSLSKPFDPDGNPCKLDRDTIKSKAARNSAATTAQA